MEETTTEIKKEAEKTTKSPDYVGDGIAVWVNKNKDGNSYLSIKLIGHNTIYAQKK